MHQRPRINAETVHIDELVARVMRGRVRVPRFQRGMKWQAADVQQLFDSIHQGFPIGTLLMWKRPAEAERLQLGPLELEAAATDQAWWVVDGQQRLTSLVAALRHPGPPAADDPFVVYHDLRPGERQPAFFRPSRLRPALPDRFDARHGLARLVGLILALQHPLPAPPATLDLFGRQDPTSDVFAWLQEHGAAVFTKLPQAPNDAAARFLTPGLPPATLREGLLGWANEDLEHPGLPSHLVTPAAALALRENRLDDFVKARRMALEAAAERELEARAEPRHPDRPPLRTELAP